MTNVVPFSPPQGETLINLDAEAALIGALLIENTLADALRDAVAGQDFYEPIHGRAFDAICAERRAGRNVNPILLKPYFEGDEALKELGGLAYFARLSGDAQGLLMAPELAAQIAELAARRRMRDAMAEATRACLDLQVPVADVAVLLGEVPKIETATSAPKLTVHDAFAFDETELPVRPWLVPGAILAGYTHMLAAPGGSGKSLFTLQLAMAMADGMHWGGFKPRKRYRSMLINVEDDLDEQRRRLSAARRVMDCKHDLSGMIHIADTAESIVVARSGERSGSIVTTPVVDTLRRYIADHRIDVLFVDPFAETFEGDENDNSQVKWAMRVWRDEIARATGCAVYLVHHTTKHAQNGAGDANVIRGAGAIVNSTRISATLMPMTADDAAMVGIEQEDRHFYVRFDDAKANQSLKSNSAKWFRKETIELDNATEDCPADFVGALVPWIPPDAFGDASIHQLNIILDKIDTGMESGERYTASARGGSIAKGRWAGCLLIDLLGMKQAQAKKVIDTWIKTGVLLEDEYHNPVRRRSETGLFAPQNTRPGASM